MEAQMRSRKAPEGQKREQEAPSQPSITRPLARRGLPLSSSPSREDKESVAHRSGASNPAGEPNPAKHRLSAWTRYQSPASSSSPPPDKIAPPPDTEANRATQAAAQQIWEQATGTATATATASGPADSENTRSNTSDSPPPPTPRGSLDTSILASMLNNLQGGGGLNPLQAMQIHEAYLESLKSALRNGAEGAFNSSNQLQQRSSHQGQQRSSQEPSRIKPEAAPANQGFRLPPEGTLTRPKAERIGGRPLPHANGSLSMLPEPNHRSSSLAEAPPSRLPPSSPFHPRPSSPGALTQLSGMTPQQVVKLLEDALRGQAPSQPSQPPFPQHSLPAEHPGSAMMGLGMHPLSYPSFARYASQEPSYREHSLGGMPYASSLAPLDPEGKLAQRRWNSCASIMSDASLVGSPPFGSLASHGGFPGSMPPNLTGPESQAFLQALQQRCQAHEMEAAANARIQQILAGSSARAPDMRKRKLPEVYYDEQPARRHNSVISEGEHYYNHPQIAGGAQQVCTECGTNNTPTWRRSGKRLLCNACGLRRSRSVRNARDSANARCNSMGPVSTLHQEPLPLTASAPKLL